MNGEPRRVEAPLDTLLRAIADLKQALRRPGTRIADLAKLLHTIIALAATVRRQRARLRRPRAS